MEKLQEILEDIEEAAVEITGDAEDEDVPCDIYRVRSARWADCIKRYVVDIREFLGIKKEEDEEWED